MTTRFSTAVTLETAGRRRAPATRMRFYLSTVIRSRADDILVADLRIRALRVGDATQRVVRLELSQTLVPGEYQVLVCADALRRVRESNERNNCAAGANFLYVRPAPAPAPVTVPPTR